MIRGGGNPDGRLAPMPQGEWARRLGALLPKRMVASWLGSSCTDPTGYKDAAQVLPATAGSLGSSESIDRSKRLFETEEVRRSQEARWLDKQIPIQTVHEGIHQNWRRSWQAVFSDSCACRREGPCGDAKAAAFAIFGVFRRCRSLSHWHGGLRLCCLPPLRRLRRSG